LLAWLCDRYHCLPSQIEKEDAATIAMMDTTRNVYRTVAHLRSLKGEQIHTLNDNERRLIKTLLNDGFI
jgi:hypothetical protein